VLVVLQIVGNLIRSFGDSWPDEVPILLKTDMASLTQEGGSLTMMERIIQTGLDSLTGPDAPHIISLFKSMAVVCAMSGFVILIHVHNCHHSFRKTRYF
jgi:hypothetical protein